MAYKFKYLDGLVPIQTSDALTTGLRYHDMLDVLYKTGDFDTADFSKESAMLQAYKKYIYPEFSVSSTEEWVEYNSDKYKLIGRIDGIATDGRIVEHKSTSLEITEAYEYDLMWDEQILAYMLMSGSREMWYTVCRKPTIRQKKGESDKEFFDRMVEWYDEDTNSKIRLMLISRTEQEIDEFKNDLDLIAEEMNATKLFYRNTGNCNRWGRRCEYSSICLNYDPDCEYVDFIKEG